MRRRSSVLLALTALAMGACGAPPELVTAPAPTAVARPRPAVTATVTAVAPASAAPEVEAAPEPPLLDPLAPLPAGAVARLGTTRMRFREETARAAGLSAEGAPLVVEATPSVLRDVLRDRVIAELGYATRSAIAADASFVVTARAKDPVVVVARHPAVEGGARWSVELKAPRVTQKLWKRTTQVAAGVDRILLSPNGSHVAVMFSSGDVTVLAAKDGAVFGRIAAGKGQLTALSWDGVRALFVDDGTFVPSSGGFGLLGLLGGLGSLRSARVKVVQVIDTRTGAVVRKLEPNVVARVTMSADGREILALWNGALVAVDVSTGARRIVREEAAPAGALGFGLLGSLPSLLVSPDGSRVAIAGETTDVVLLADGTVAEKGLEGTPLCFSQDGAMLLMRVGEVANVIGKAHEVPDGHEAEVAEIAFAAGGKLLVSRAEDVRFWNPRTGRSLAQAERVRASAIASDPAAEHLVMATPELHVAKADGKLADIGPPEPGSQTGTKPGVEHAAPLPGGEVVAVVTEQLYGMSGGRLRLWSMTETKEIARMDVESPSLIAAGPDGDRIAVFDRGSARGVHVFHAKSLEWIRTLPGSGWWGMSLAFAGNDARLLVGDGDDRQSGLTLFDVDRGEPLARYHGASCCRAGAASRDGRLVAGASGKAVMLWQVEPRKLLSVFRGHTAPVNALAFSPDGALLASASEDTSILVWSTSASVLPAREMFTMRIREATSTRALAPDLSGILIAEAGVPKAGAPSATPVTPAPTGRLRKVTISQDGSPTYADVPGRVPDVRRVASVGIARCALDGKGDVRCWGRSYGGALGTGPAPTGKGKPLSIDAPRLLKLPAKATDIVAGNAYVCAVLAGGSLSCWGTLLRNEPSIPGSEALADALPAAMSGLVDVVSAGIGNTFACALEKGGGVRCWGKGDSGQLGDSLGKGSAVPVPVPGITDARALSVGAEHACVVRASGAVTCWGDAENDQLGEGTGATTRTQRTFGTGFTEVAAGGTWTCGRKSGGEVLCWGVPGRRGVLPLLEPTEVPEAAGLTSIRMMGDMLCGDRNGTEVVCVGFRAMDL